MAMTDAQRSYIRAMTGDDLPADYLVSDDMLDVHFTNAEDDVPTAIVYALRQMMAKTARRTDVRGEFGTDRLSQWHTQIVNDLLPYWESTAGVVSGGGIVTGEIDTGLDYEAD